MNTIWIGNYNNYYNRIHKPIYVSAALYSQNGYTNTHAFSNINFNLADSVNTKLTINLNPATTDYNDHVNPDYLLVCTGATYNPVESRWFILESEWNRDHQLVLTLRRDLISDFWANFKDNDFYCEKGPIPTGYDVAKYNSEGMKFNQLCKERIPLLPSTGQTKRYIVGYVDKGWPGGDVFPGASLKATYSSFENSPFYNLKRLYVDGSAPYFNNSSRECLSAIVRYIKIGMVKANNPMDDPNDPQPGTTAPNATIRCYTSEVRGVLTGDLVTNRYAQIGANCITNSSRATAIAAAISEEAQDLDSEIVASCRDRVLDYDTVSDLNNSTIRIGNEYYSVTITDLNSTREIRGSYPNKNGSNGWDNQLMIAAEYKIRSEGWWTDGNIWWNEDFSSNIVPYTSGEHWRIDLTTVTTGKITIPQNRPSAGQLPYDIFFVEDNATTREFAANFANQYYGGNVLYDIQVLPFEPYSNDTTGQFSIGSYTAKWATRDYLEGKFKHKKIASYSTDTEYKVGSNLHMCRIYSPDGAACWDFNPAKIGGVAKDSIRYEVTFAPLRPYMHIFPNFGGIYGSVNKNTSTDPNEGEPRGLICTGDYSIPYSTNNWSTYQLQNSAYQLSHDRMIENMSVLHTAERAQETFNILTGSISGSFAGAQSGAMMGGVYGAIAGGVIGGAGSLAGGLLSHAYNERLRAEELSYAEDMFAYSLQNIKAQAQPLVHSNSLTIGVAFFPYVEVYGSTSDEETIFTERLRVNGWSLGIVTTMEAMKTAASAAGAPTSFVKGRLVKFGGDDDAHVSAEIDKELQRGVRFS